eukprot:augustus_masked-scaffold_7-processed-gene-3.9-mRNA-1 protein AED:1.00 eAED:1.00 QI:0/0/0/0/1/1/5/0/809
MRKSKRLQGETPPEVGETDQEKGTAVHVGRNRNAQTRTSWGSEQEIETEKEVEDAYGPMASIPTTSLVTSELILQLVEALKPGITDIVHEAVTQLRNEILEKQNKNKKRTEKQHKNKEVIGTDEEEVTDGLDKQNDDNSTDPSEYSLGGSQRRETQKGDGRKESELDVGKARLKETQISGKPMLKGLQADEIYKFQLLFSRWEKAVVQEGLGLTEATIMNYLSEKLLLELHMSKVDTSSGAAVMHHLEKIRSQGIESKKASILTDVSRKVKWTNEGNISVSMSSYLQQIDKLLLGIELAEDPYLDKLLCLEVLKRLAKAFKGPNPKHTIKRRRLTSYYVMRKDLSDLARLLAPPQDFDDPALRMAHNTMGPVKREPRTENVRYKQPRRHPQRPGGVEQRVRKEEGICEAEIFIKFPGRIAVVGGDTVNATTHYEDTEPESSGVSIFSDEECYRVHVFEDPDSEEQEEKAIVRALNEVTRELKCPEPSDPSGLEADGLPSDPDKDTSLSFEQYVRIKEQGFGENTAMDRDAGVGEEQLIRSIIDERFTIIASKTPAPNEDIGLLWKVYMDNWDAFAVSQSECQLSDLTQMEVELKPGARPFAAKAHVVVGEKKDFLEGKLLDLEKIGAIERDPNPYFSSPVLVVPKATKAKFRMVIDLTRLNDNTIRNSFGLPHWETQMAWIGSENRYFACFDAISGFDMLKVSEKASKYFGISTIFGSYRLKCSPMGYHSTPGVYSDRIISEVLALEGGKSLFGRSKGEGVVQWLDDSLVYATTMKELADTIQQFLTNAKKKNLRLNINKCVLLTTSPT